MHKQQPTKSYRKNSGILHGKSISSELDDLSLKLEVEIVEGSAGNVGTNRESANGLYNEKRRNLIQMTSVYLQT